MRPHIEVAVYDRSGEKSSVRLNFAANLDATEYGDVLSDVGGWIDALEAITLAEVRQYVIVPVVYIESPSLPTSPYAQRELRAIFRASDLVLGRRFDIGVPCPDMGEMGQIGTDAINMSNVQVAAYKLAVETFAVSPFKNALSIVGGTVTGRPS